MSDFALDTANKEITFDVDGIAGAPGAAGKSAYELAVKAGYTGTLEQWLAECHPETRVTSLDATSLASAKIIEAVGNPVYVDDVTAYADYGITETGWYVFARIAAMPGVDASSAAVAGAAGVILADDHVDVAVRFEVSSVSQPVAVTWGGDTETFVFKATDLAVRNLDYRVTFYVYDADPYITWEYTFASDAVFTSGKYYYVEKDGEYTLTKDYVVGDPIPAYYKTGLVYVLTADSAFADGKTYYTKNGTEYVEATVTVGSDIPAGTYYEASEGYVRATGVFLEGVTYYTLTNAEYVEATVTVGSDIPAYYVHSKAIISGLTPNITYRCNTVIDCPSEFILPVVDDDTHGCWYEIRFRHSGSFSSTLTPPSSDVKIATEHTQAETAGINMVDLHYSDVGGIKVWRFMNTHSNFTASTPVPESIAFRGLPALTYNAGDVLDLTGAEIVASLDDGTKSLVTGSCTFTPAAGTALTADDTELVASYTVGDITVTTSAALTVS